MTLTVTSMATSRITNRSFDVFCPFSRALALFEKHGVHVKAMKIDIMPFNRTELSFEWFFVSTSTKYAPSKRKYWVWESKRVADYRIVLNGWDRERESLFEQQKESRKVGIPNVVQFRIYIVVAVAISVPDVAAYKWKLLSRRNKNNIHSHTHKFNSIQLKC